MPHRTFEGNRPSNVILAEKLTPEALGALVRALRAQRVHPGRDLGINSFDQWGVELGKVLAKRIVPELEAAEEPELAHDSSTNALIRRYRRCAGACFSFFFPAVFWAATGTPRGHLGLSFLAHKAPGQKDGRCGRAGPTR